MKGTVREFSSDPTFHAKMAMPDFLKPLSNNKNMEQLNIVFLNVYLILIISPLFLKSKKYANYFSGETTNKKY